MANIIGSSAAEFLNGTFEADTIDGGAGNDTMAGGAGDDTYVASSTLDVVTELAGEGTDTVQSAVTHQLASNVENATLTGTGSAGLTGNTLGNVLTGNAASNDIVGQSGNDTILGGSGNDVLTGDSTSSSEGSGTEMTGTASHYLEVAGNNLVNELGGGAGFGEGTLFANDDSFTSAIDITPVFGSRGLDFFGNKYTGLYVNNNGNLTFTGPSGVYTPNAIGSNLFTPVIAAYWADVDTRGAAGGVTPGGSSTGTNLVYYDIDAINRVFTATWDDVGYYSSQTDKLNAFQIQLVDRGGGDFDIIFRYEAVNWTTGSASGGSGGLGGSVARAGYSAGSGNTNYFELGQSGNQDAMLALDSTMGNSGRVGVYTFSVRNGNVLAIGNDVVDGGVGNDIINGGGGSDSLVGGDGDDRFITAEGDSGDDIIDGGAGADTFLEDTGNDVLIGGAGDDTFLVDYTGGAAVTASGGEGRDSYLLGGALPDYTYVVTDFQAGEGGDAIGVESVLDLAALSGFYTGGDPFAQGFVRLLQDGADTLVQWDRDGAARTAFDWVTGIRLVGVAEETLVSDNFPGLIIGNNRNNRLGGTADDDIMLGLGGNDSLNGGAGSDLLFGGTGADTMRGGTGDDTFQVDNVKDQIIETSNATGALLVPGGGADGPGHLDVSGIGDTVISAINFTLGAVQHKYLEHLTLTGSAAQATGNALNNNITGNKGNNTLVGDAGNDTLDGGVAGNDTMQGDAGNDVMVWGSTDTFDGGTGTDVLKLLSGDLNLTTVANSKIRNVETIDMTDGGDNILTIAARDVLDISSSTNTLKVLGNGHDSIDIDGSFADKGAVAGGLHRYTFGKAALLVSEDVTVS
jgi:Ca2+-binding RTX toxin-like protein